MNVVAILSFDIGWNVWGFFRYLKGLGANYKIYFWLKYYIHAEDST